MTATSLRIDTSVLNASTLENSNKGLANKKIPKNFLWGGHPSLTPTV